MINLGGISGGGILNAAFAVTQVPAEYRTRRIEGQGIFEAAGKSTNNAFWWASLSLYGALALPEVAKIPGALYNNFTGVSYQTRRASQPFSQSVRHSQMASNMQGYAMSRMNDMEGFGNEASMMYGRFGRM